MKFILVNHRAPLNTVACTECDRSLGTGYLREVSSQRQYCDYDCYLKFEAKSLLMPWLAAPHDHARRQALATTDWPATPYVASYAFAASVAAATCWYSISFARTALRISEIMATESFAPFSGGG